MKTENAEADIRDQKNKIVMIQDQLSFKNGELRQLQSELAECEQESLRLKFQVGEFEGHINTLKGLDKQCFEENTNLDTDFTRNVTDNATMNARINELCSQIRIKEEIIMGLNAQLSRESAQSNHLHDANQKIQYDVDGFR